MHNHATANRSFRLVWSAARGAYVVAPETASGRSKSSISTSAPGSGQASRLATAVAFSFGVAWCGGTGFDAAAQVLPAPTTVVPAGGNTKAYTNPNGVPVVNIATANAAGLSNNLYIKYNVDPNGLVLNNIANASGGRSHLAGQVQGNLNLNAPAQVILNQVVSPNRSSLAGFTEVLGNKADVIVANPYGITCSGCGFINTDRVTLTTGLPTIAADGSLTGFSVTGGDILVNGTGLNASAQQILDLVTRSVRLDGQVNAASTGAIGITTGNNQWTYGSRTVTGSTAGSGTTPSFAVDSTALGGMYAGRIQLIATEAGVGVRMLGEVAASTDDFTLSSAGKIDLRSKVAAKRDVSVTTTATGADAINLANAQLSATRNLQLQSATGGATVNGGVLVAGGSLNLALTTLSDIQSSAAITDNNKRFGDTVSITTTGAAALDGTSWGAAKALNANLGSLDVGASGGTLSGGTTTTLATSGDMNLGKATVWSSGDMSLTAATGAIRTAAGGQGVESKTGKLDISAGNGLDNDGAIAASNGAISIKVNGTLDNAGTLYSKSAMTISDKAGAATENILNSGTLLADGTLNVQAAQVTNSGNLQGTGGTTLTANNLNNSGKFIASSAAGTSATLNLATLNNSGAGTVQASQDLALNVSGSLTNAGNVIAGRNLGITSTGSGLTVTNQSGGALQAGAASGSTLSVAGPAVTLNNNAGAKMLGDKFTVAAATVNNDGTLQGGTGASTLAVTGTLTNTGTVTLATGGAGSGTVSANQITNSGTLQSTGAATLSAINALNNTVTGKIMANQLALTTASLMNAGVLQGGNGASTLNVTNTLTNAGTGTLTLATSSAGSGTITANALTNDGIMQSTGAATLNVATTLNNNASGKVMADRLTVNSASLANAGVLQGGTGASTLNVTNTLTNSGTLTLATTTAASGTINADQVTNSGTLQSLGSAAINVTTGVTNTAAGKIITGTGLTVRGTDVAYAVDNQGLMQSGGALDVKGQGGGTGVAITIGGSGKMLGQTVALNTQNLTIANGGSLGSTGDMTVAANTLTLGGSTAKIVGATAGGNTTITTTNAFSNPGAIHSGGNLAFNALSLDNTATGGMSALGNLTVTASAGDISNSGALYAGNTLTATAAGHTITNVGTLSGQVGTMDSGGDMNLTAGTFVNNSAVRAGGSMTVNAGTFKNEVAGGDTRTTVVGPMSAKESLGITWHEWAMYSEARSGISNTEHFRQTWTETTSFANDKTPTYTPQMTAGTAITIEGLTGTASGNRGATISAPTVNIRGAAGSQFTNDSLASGAQTYQKTWDEWDLCVGLTCASLWVTNEKRLEVARQLYGNVTTSPLTSGIYATTFNASGFGLTNITSSYGSGPVVKTATPVGGTNLAGTTTLAGTTSAVINVAPVGSASTITFGGIVINLPTSPNGYFVISRDDDAKYLVETNPLFATVTNLYGSAYLANQFGLDADGLTKRLGDNNYEAYLIRQQLIAQTGNNLLTGYQKESDLLQAMMEKGAVEAKRLNFTWGAAPTNDMLANLQQDLVWMVYVEIGNEKVLTPVVYLSQTTVAGIQTGAVIQAKNINMTNMASVTNTGGTIIGSESINITASDDIKNQSGTIKGGNVALKSTSGNIINETTATSECHADASSCRTVIGNTASIEATGDLKLDAANDVRIIGADLNAGGAAELVAGRGIVVDTIVDKTRTTDIGEIREQFASVAWHSVTNTSVHKGSNIVTGGNLTLQSKGGDTSLYSANVDVGGNLNATSSGQLLVGTREDVTHTKSTVSTTTAWGHGLSAGAQAKADLIVDPAATIGPTTRDYSQETYANAKQVGTLGGSAVAYADSRDINRVEGAWFSKTTATLDDVNKTSKASTIKVGGNVDMTASTGKITIQGSDVQAKGNVALTANSVEVLAAKDERITTTTSNKMSTGVYADARSVSSAEAGASSVNFNEKADVQLRTENDAAVTFGGRTETKSTTENTVKNQGSRISSGGNLTVAATDAAKFVGSQMAAGNNLTISAKDIVNEAAVDEHSKKTTWSQETQGISVDGKADSQAYARARATAIGTPGAGAKALVDGKVEVGIGYRVNQRSGVVDSGSTNSIGNEFTAGNNVTRTATEKITDQATAITATRGDIVQTAKVIEDVAVSDTAWQNKTEANKDYRAGVYVGGWGEGIIAQQAGSGGYGMNPGVDPTLDATIGLRITTQETTKVKNDKVEKAVTSSYTSGGKIDSTSTGKTTLAGASLNAGGDVNISAGTFEFKAAKDTDTRLTTNVDMKNEVRAGLAFTASVPDAAITAGGLMETVTGYDQMTINQNATTARAGSINSGGQVKITGTGATGQANDVRLEGTAVTAVGTVQVNSVNGNVVLDAAESKTTKTALGGAVTEKNRGKLGIGVSATTGLAWEVNAGMEANAGHISQTVEKTTNTGAIITSNTGDVNLSAGKALTLKGAAVEATFGNVDLKGKTGVSLLEATNTSTLSMTGTSSFTTAGGKSTVSGTGASAAFDGTFLTAGQTVKDGKVTSITSGTDKETRVATDSGKIVSQAADLKGGKSVIKGTVTDKARSNSNVHTGFSIDVDIVGSVGIKPTRTAAAQRIVDVEMYEAKNRMEFGTADTASVERVQTRTALVAPAPGAAPSPPAAPSVLISVPSKAAGIPAPVLAPAAVAVAVSGPGTGTGTGTTQPGSAPVMEFASVAAPVAPTARTPVETREAAETRVQAPKPGVAPQVKVAVTKPVIKAPPAKVPPRAPRNPRGGRSLEANGAGQTASPATLAPVSANQQATPVTVSANGAPQ